MLIYRNAERVGYMARESLITLVLNLTQSRRHGGAFVGLVPQTKLPTPQIET